MACRPNLTEPTTRLTAHSGIGSRIGPQAVPNHLHTGRLV